MRENSIRIIQSQRIVSSSGRVLGTIGRYRLSLPGPALASDPVFFSLVHVIFLPPSTPSVPVQAVFLLAVAARKGQKEY